MDRRYYTYLLVLIFALALGIRLYLAFQNPNFSLNDSYFAYRQVDSIKADLVPSYHDDLSYSGRTHIFQPVYYYVLAFFSFFLGTALALKIVPNVLACTLVFIVYLIVFELTKKKGIALFSAFSSAFIPVFFASTVNSSSILSFTLPLTFYLLYCFMRINNKAFLYQFLLLSFVLSLTSAISFLFVFALLLYLLLVKLEFAQVNRTEMEVILFITSLTLWVNVLLYKKAFLFHSYALIWQNIPVQILDTYFREIDVVGSVTSIGLIPLLFGIYAVYRYMFKERDKRTYLLMAFAIAVAILLWFKLITLEVGLIYLGTILVPLLGQALDLFFSYLERTKISSYEWVFWSLIMMLMVLTAVLPSIAKASVSIHDSVTNDEIDALLWIKNSTPKDSVVLSTISEGNLVSAISGRKDVADDDFILIRSSDIVFDDIRQMYTSILKTDAVELLNKYGVDYIYLSPRAKAEFNITDLRYADKDCFELVYDKGVKVYRSTCEVKSA